jgi:hypothetical protein
MAIALLKQQLRQGEALSGRAQTDAAQALQGLRISPRPVR